MDDGTIKRLAELYFMRIDDSHRSFGKACYAKGRQDTQERIAELERDAARYRWLRGDSGHDYCVRWAQWEIRRWYAPLWTGDLRGSELDREIDAAMRKEGVE